MPTEYKLETQEPVKPPEPPIEEPRKPLPLRLIIGGAALAILVVFSTGLLFGRVLFTQPPVPTPTPTPVPTLAQGATPTPTVFSELPQAAVKFLPGKQYFDDAYVVIQKAKPRVALILSVARIEQERNYTQYIKLNYFNGVDWIRKTVTNTIFSSQVTTNPLLRNFALPTTRQENKHMLAQIDVENQQISVFSNDLQNEISIQSLPGSTKFVYQGQGSIKIGEDEEEAYVFYTKTYSFNAVDLAFLNNPQNLTSDWVVFWDNEGNFYHVDQHRTPQPKSAIENQKIAVKESANRSVQKITAFNTSIQNQTNNTRAFLVQYDKPIEDELELTFSNLVNKADKKTYTWILSIAEGRVVMNEGRTVPGVGMFEYIRPQQ